MINMVAMIIMMIMMVILMTKMTKNCKLPFQGLLLGKKGPTNSGMGRPPPHSGNAQKKTFFSIDVFPQVWAIQGNIFGVPKTNDFFDDVLQNTKHNKCKRCISKEDEQTDGQEL